jgi:DNA-binding MarR family transcriptional regulator
MRDLADREMAFEIWRIHRRSECRACRRNYLLTRKRHSGNFLVNGAPVPNDKPPSDLHHHLGYWLRAVSNAVSQNFARQIEKEGVTVAEWVFLRVLYDANRIAPSMLAERMGMTRGAISKLAERLGEKGLVEHEANPTDRRAQVLALTHAGRAMVPALAEIADANDATFFKMLAPDEQRALRALLMKIVSERKLTKAPID